MKILMTIILCLCVNFHVWSMKDSPHKWEKGRRCNSDGAVTLPDSTAHLLQEKTRVRRQCVSLSPAEATALREKINDNRQKLIGVRSPLGSNGACK